VRVNSEVVPNADELIPNGTTFSDAADDLPLEALSPRFGSVAVDIHDCKEFVKAVFGN
jgi:hypothetical protein